MISVRTYLSALMIFCAFTAGAAVRFQFDARSSTGSTSRATMEKNISALLTEINRAGNDGTPLNLSGLTSVQMESGAKERLQALWNEDAHFICNKETNISNCLNDFQGFQVRKIPVTVKPQNSSYNESLNRELTISLNKRGTITGVRFAWDLQEDVETMLRTTLTNGVGDLQRRREILKWVEDFRCYYNEKNIKALNQIYSDDALIITGSVVMNRKVSGDNAHLRPEVKYSIQSKEQYISKLVNIFKTRRVNVEFDHISVMSHGAKPGIYGVTLHQKWRAGSYYDEGWLFLLWDFNDPEKPQIHVRTWQPDQVVAKDGVFTLDDFFIP